MIVPVLLYYKEPNTRKNQNNGNEESNTAYYKDF